MLKKYWKWITVCVTLVIVTVIFLFVCESTTVRIVPNALMDVDIDDKNVASLVSIENGEMIDYVIIDEHNEVVETFMMEKQYQFCMNVKSLLNTKAYCIPITFRDYTAPSVTVYDDINEAEFNEEPNWEIFYEVYDNVDLNPKVNLFTDDFNSTLVGVIQNVKGVVTDKSGNSTAMEINIKVKAPNCASDAHFNGNACICNDGFSGDGWVGCVPKPIRLPEVSQHKQEVINSHKNDESSNVTVNDNELNTNSNESAFPSWGFDINEESYHGNVNQGQACDDAGNAGVGKPNNAKGWACLFKDNQYYLTYFDENDQIVAQIGGY